MSMNFLLRGSPTPYEKDFYAWTQEQARILRKIGDIDGLDASNVAEEIEDLGESQRRQVEIYIKKLFVHAIKASLSPMDEPKGHWYSEMYSFMREMQKAFKNSMTQNIDVHGLWRDAVKEAEYALSDYGIHKVKASPESPLPLADLVNPGNTVEDVVGLVGQKVKAS